MLAENSSSAIVGMKTIVIIYLSALYTLTKCKPITRREPNKNKAV